MSDDFYSHLPGGDRIRAGVADMAAMRCTADALLVEIAAQKLRELGVPVPMVSLVPAGVPDAEHALYFKLGETESDPYPAYNARLRELVSFAHALEPEVRRARQTKTTR
jgi:hypothetical protein